MNRASTCLAAIILSLTVSAFGEERVNDPTSFTWNPELSTSSPVVVIVDEAMSGATRSQPRFFIMQGSVPKK